jgi:protein-tyrosine phosphatase
MKILMVCLGNICRSPLAEGVLRHKIEREKLAVIVDSAGTSGFHIGHQPDERMIDTALSFGIDLRPLHARQFEVSDFDVFDIIYVMDSSNYNNVIALSRTESDRLKVKLILNELTPGQNHAVPDPYYGDKQAFIEVFQLVDQVTDTIIQKLKAHA